MEHRLAEESATKALTAPKALSPGSTHLIWTGPAARERKNCNGVLCSRTVHAELYVEGSRGDDRQARSRLDERAAASIWQLSTTFSFTREHL